jgi:ribosomal protein L40E
MSSQPEPFHCRNCGTRYELVRVKAEPTMERRDLICWSCGAQLPAREGRCALKYFFTNKSGKREAVRRKARSLGWRKL